ncbi:MAG: NADP-dependent malic enzyme [Bacteroidetes bacterium]|nr:NADP-dependent malic enzyme [Bacteroidota bacterium]
MSDKKHLDALSYHADGRPGKIEVITTKPTQTQFDLALAYSPGVAVPCLKIAENTDDVYKYTAKGNLVAVISNGTAVLGLGDIGPEASKPVMEGKGVLFKIFADIDVFDIELNCKDVDEFVRTVKAMEPTFGGINLEDIKAPESFEIEERLKAELNIPIMHDDQHGTAIISGAGLINALRVVDKRIEEIKLVVNGAGASAIACTKLFVSLGVKIENITMLDSKGVIHAGRTDLDKYKRQFITDRAARTLEESMVGADVFVGLSKGNILTPEMIKSMAPDPIVFAMANPDPEIDYNLAMATRDDVLVATGRSDFPNQVNNVLGFPFIFRGALDVRATTINEEMKLAAVRAIADLALEPVPEVVMLAYNDFDLSFGRNYIIPKPMDPRLLTAVAPAVAKAAMESGVARNPIADWDVYKAELRKRLGIDNDFVNRLVQRARKNPKRVVFAEANDVKILRAAQLVLAEKIAEPILLGNKVAIRELMEEYNIDLDDATIMDPWEEDELCNKFGTMLYEKRQRHGFTLFEAIKQMRNRNYFGNMMLEAGMADAFISGLTRNYPIALRPSLECIGITGHSKRVAGMHVVMTKNGPLFLADTTVNIDYKPEELVDLVLKVHDRVRQFRMEPKIALVTYSNFGSSKGPAPQQMKKAVEMLHANYPEIMVDGEMQTTYALDGETRMRQYPFNKLGDQNANTLIFPGLNSGNAAFQLMRGMGIVDIIGPILLGFEKSVHILHHTSTVREIVNMTALAVCEAQDIENG